MTFASVLVLVLEVYAATGVAVALLFLTIGVGRIDKAASHSYVFRVLLIPGVILLWPLVLIRWSRLSRGPTASIGTLMQRKNRQAHARIWAVLCFALPLMLLAALMVRQNGPLEAPAVRLDPPAGPSR